MGNAEIPAAPIIGFTFSFVKRFRSFAKRTPAAVSKIKAARPITMIRRVCGLTKDSALILKATVIPRSRETRLERIFCAASERLFSTPHSRSRLPNIRNPTRETDIGATRPATKVTTMGKMIFAFLETLTALYSIWMQRSFFVVSRRMTTGWMIGTRAMYE